MLAIPSPDLLVNLFASGAQVLGLLTLLVGGASVARRRSAKAAGKRGSPWAFRITALLLVATGVSFVFYALSVEDATNRRLRTNLVRTSTEKGKKVGDT